jgi:hypothetical protein
MHSKELAAKLIAVLEKNCPGIRHDYSLRDIEREFDRTLAEDAYPVPAEANRLQSSFGF